VSIQNMISTSAEDCRITLEGELRRDPANAARTAIDLLEELWDMEGQSSRRKVAGSIIRKASKALEGGGLNG